MEKSKWEHRTIKAKDDKEFTKKVSGYKDFRIIRIVEYGHGMEDEYSVSVKI